MAGLPLQSRQARCDRGTDFGVDDHVLDLSAVGQSSQRAAGGDVREHQKAHLVAVMARYDDILRQRRPPFHPSDARRADADPSAGAELELFGPRTSTSVLSPDGERSRVASNTLP